MNILVAGFTGYVGTIMRRHLDLHHTVYGVSSRCAPDGKQIQCDLIDKVSVMALADRIRPDVVIHAAGNKDIHYCEKNPNEAFRVNCDTVKHLAEAFGTQSRFIYLSTDYVFSGQRGQYKEDDTPDPVTTYGKSKLCGEIEGKRIAQDNFTIIRLSALYDRNASFPRYLFDRLSRREPVECYTDTVYSPTYYKDFLSLLDKVILSPSSSANIFHSCGPPTTRYDFARTFAEVFQFSESLIQRAAGKRKGLYLYPDLSLQNERTRLHLKTTTTPMKIALEDMKRGISL